MTALAFPFARILLHGLGVVLTVLLTEGLILFLLAYAASRLFRSLSPGHRHLLWFLVILGFALLPAARLLLPVVQFQLFQQGGGATVSRIASVPFEYQENVTTAIAPLGETAATAVEAGAAVVPFLLPGIWLLGFLTSILRPAIGRIVLGRLSHAASRPLSKIRWEELAARIGTRRVSLVVHSQITIPFTYGFYKPRIVLPEASRRWTRERLEAVLIHELTHVKRADCLSRTIARMVCAFLWFIPFVWVAYSLMLQEAEISCDQSVLANGIRGSDYASAILGILTAARGQLFLSKAYSSIATTRKLKERIRRILLDGGGSTPPTHSSTRRVLVVGFSVLLPLLALTWFLKEGEKLYGSWMRDNGPELCEDFKYAWDANGTGHRFASVLPEIAAAEGRFIIDKKWTDSQGYTWYEVRSKWSNRASSLKRDEQREYTLIRLDPSGANYEAADSPTGYPKQFSGPLGGDKHQVYKRL